MNRADAVNCLRAHEAELKKLGVLRLYLFGSTARDDSDVDLFFDHEKGALGLFELMEVKDRAAAILGRAADITTRAGLHPALRRGIEASAVLVF